MLGYLRAFGIELAGDVTGRRYIRIKIVKKPRTDVEKVGQKIVSCFIMSRVRIKHILNMCFKDN